MNGHNVWTPRALWVGPVYHTPHLHREVDQEDQQAERLDCLCQATGRLPGLGAVAHIRSPCEGRWDFHKGQDQDQKNGEAQHSGKEAKSVGVGLLPVEPGSILSGALGSKGRQKLILPGYGYCA